MNDHSHDASSSSNSSRSQQIALVLMILLAVAGLVFRWEPGNQHPKAEEATAARITPDTVINQPELDIFDENGRKIRQLQGLQLQHFATDNHSVISEAYAQFQKKTPNLTGDNFWQLKGNQAILSNNNSVIELHGNVLLWKNDTEAGKTEFRTERLLVNMSGEIAETDKPVKIHHLSSTAEATGMRANLTDEKITLLSHVKEVHEFRH